MFRHLHRGAAALFLAAAMAAPAAAQDDDLPGYMLVIRDHKFEPAELKVPAGIKFEIVVRNADPTPEEFESYDFNREVIVAGGGEVRVIVGPLAPGRYTFFGEFHMDTATGVLIAE